jgi:hypothetical protein
VLQSQPVQAKRKLQEHTKGNKNCNNEKRRPFFTDAFLLR